MAACLVVLVDPNRKYLCVKLHAGDYFSHSTCESRIISRRRHAQLVCKFNPFSTSPFRLDTGDTTTCYSRCLQAGSDPTVLARIGQGDKDCLARLQFSFSTPPPAGGEPSELQYLVKWQKWSHLHNTWETESSLLAKDVRGMKKFYNFLKREEEQALWEQTASMEDIEYVQCQEELGEQLLVNFTQVEKVIGQSKGQRSIGEEMWLCCGNGVTSLYREHSQKQALSILKENNSWS